MMSRVNIASLRIGGVVTLAMLLFWSVWHFTVGSVPNVRELLLIREATFVLPDWQVLGLSIWSRWTDVPVAGLYAATLTQIIMRTKEEDLTVFQNVFGPMGLCFSLAVGLVVSPVLGLVVILFVSLAVSYRLLFRKETWHSFGAWLVAANK